MTLADETRIREIFREEIARWWNTSSSYVEPTDAEIEAHARSCIAIGRAVTPAIGRRSQDAR